MGVFDNTARRAAKRNGVGFFQWTMPLLDPAVTFADWLDARTAPPPPPPETELTCDALAEFATADHPELPWMMVAEFQTEPTEDDLERLIEYMFRFRRERRPGYDPRLKYLVSGVIVNLTGPQQQDGVSMAVPGMPSFGLSGRIVRIAVRERDAAAVLTQIAAGKLNRCILPWVSLMRGGATADVIEQWKRLADLEPNVPLRLQYAADALIFAELSGNQPQWKQALEGWNVKVSQQVLEWQAEAELKRQRANLVRLLEKRCKTSVPDDLALAIQSTTDMDLLAFWFDSAAETNDYDEFRKSIHQRS